MTGDLGPVLALKFHTWVSEAVKCCICTWVSPCESTLECVCYLYMCSTCVRVCALVHVYVHVNMNVLCMYVRACLFKYTKNNFILLCVGE